MWSTRKIRIEHPSSPSSSSSDSPLSPAMLTRIHECKKNLTIEKLDKYFEFFKDYVDKYGEEKPLKTTSESLNTWGNWALSFTHFVATNQVYAKRARDSIAKAKRLSDKPEESNRKAAHVLAAIEELKKIHTEMCNAKATGSVKDNIENIFKEFSLPLEDKEYIIEIDKIAHAIKNLRYVPVAPPTSPYSKPIKAIEHMLVDDVDFLTMHI